MDEVADVIAGKMVAGRQAEVKEVKNAYEAYDKVMTFDPYNIKDFLKAHKLMTEGLISESGKFRNGDVGVFDGDVVVHDGARPQFWLPSKRRQSKSPDRLAIRYDTTRFVTIRNGR